MGSNFQCNIVTAENELFSGKVRRIIVPGIMGEMGIFPGHSPLLTRIKAGVVRFLVQDEEMEEKSLYISGGFIEVVPKCTTLLAEKALRADDIDEKSAIEAKNHAVELMEANPAGFSYTGAVAQLDEALAMLHLLEISRNRKKNRPI